MKVEGVVVDTNVLISAALIETSLSALLLAHCAAHHKLLFSDPTFEEFATRLWRPKFDRYLTIEDRRNTLSAVTKGSSWVAIPPETALRRFSRDPDDDKFLHTAMAGQARVLISGDRDLLDLKIVDGIEIITPARAHARWLG